MVKSLRNVFIGLTLALVAAGACAQTSFTDAQQHRRIHTFVHEGQTMEISIFTTGTSDWYMALTEELIPGTHDVLVLDKISPDYSVNDASNFMEMQVNPYLSGSGGGGTGWPEVAQYLGDRIAEYSYNPITGQFSR